MLRQSLDTVLALVEGLSVRQNRSLADVLRCIDRECVDPLADFAEARQSLVKRFGMAVYAEVMTEFASAERLINRSWSAAADGYVDEVEQSLVRAKAHLTRARDLLQAAEAAID